MHDCNGSSTAPGRLTAAVVYVLYIGSVMAVVTAPLGMLLAWWRMRRAEEVARSHLIFQVRTFWIGAVAGGCAYGTWYVLGMLDAPSWVSWTLGYVFFTLALVWMLGRCAVGIRRLMSGLALADSRSLLFGGAKTGRADPDVGVPA